jgi:putative spermidine/putrescine transport system substrate-binding protein
MSKTKFTDITHLTKSAGPTRRRFLVGAGTVAAVSATSGPLILVPGKAKAGEQVVVATWGGRFAEALTESFYKPFTAETGIEVIVTGAPDLAKITAAVKTDSVDIDVADVVSGWILKGDKQGLFAPLDRSIINVEGIIPEAVRDNQLGYASFAGGIGWSNERAPERSQHPETWPEFWDTETFPGRRGLRTRIVETLEVAVMGDGVNPKEVYPIDVERGFAALDRLRDHLQFIGPTPKTIERISTNECDFTHTYNGRAFGANKAGIPIGYSFKQNFIGLAWCTAISKSPNPVGAQRLIASFTNVERQGRFGSMIAYPGTNPASRELVDADVRPWTPDVTAPDACIDNLDWWGDKVEELTERYKEWQIS